MIILILLSCIIFRSVLPLLKHASQPIRSDGPDHHKKSSTPTMGGLVVIIGVLLQSWYMNTLYHPIAYTFVGFGLLGFWDDFLKLYYQSSKGLKAKYKFICQWLMAFVILVSSDSIATDVNFGLFSIDLGYLYYIFASLIVVSSSNAYNLTDGIDGLAASQALIIVFLFGVISVAQKELVLTEYTIMILTVLIGFYLQNRYPAKLFMGDVGSLSIGAVLGMFAILLKIECLYAFVAIVMIIETVSVIVQVIYYKLGYGRFFKMAPIHHHFELCGWSEKKIVKYASVTTALAASLAWMLYAV